MTITPFAEVLFPADISAGAAGGMRFNTTVTPLPSGREHRNINWLRARGEWDVSKGLQTQEQIEACIDFFAARRGKAIGFRYKDWGDYRMPRWRSTPGDMGDLPVLFITQADVTKNAFQLQKVYSDAGGTYVRPLYKIAPGSLRLANYDTGLPLIAGSDFTVDENTGSVSLSPALALTGGNRIIGACEFHVPVRFNTDDMRITITTTEIMAWESIPIIEIKDF